MKKSITIIGGGPAALMLAATLNEKLFDVCIYEKNKTFGRKFLVAGNGGFNLTHSEPVGQFISRYTPSEFFEGIITSFTNTDLQQWLKQIGIPTYTGSSKRIFPVESIKPIEVLDAILKELKSKNVKMFTSYTWCGWNTNGGLVFKADEKTIEIKSDITVFALGGASWKITGSDGMWTKYFEQKGVGIIPFQPSNCAFKIEWPKILLQQAGGQPLKNILLKCGEKEKKGEVVVTDFGLEGNAIYALSPQIRKQLNENDAAIIYLDMKPDLSADEILQRLNAKPGNTSITNHLRDQLKLNKAQLSILKTLVSKNDFINQETLAHKTKNLPLQISGTAPIDEAISTTGGISLKEIDNNFQLKKLPGHYAIGEMLDWEAPTGGYLLQACFSMGNLLGRYLNGNLI